MVAVDFLNQHIFRWALDTDALIAIGDFDVVEVAVISAYNINTIRATLIGASDGNMKDFRIRNVIED